MMTSQKNQPNDDITKKTSLKMISQKTSLKMTSQKKLA